MIVIIEKEVPPKAGLPRVKDLAAGETFQFASRSDGEFYMRLQSYSRGGDLYVQLTGAGRGKTYDTSTEAFVRRVEMDTHISYLD